MTRELTLAERLIVHAGALSRRSDIVVRTRSAPWSGPIGRWQSVLPRDMFEFYSQINGLSFGYSLADDPDGYNGFALIALLEDGKRTVDTVSRQYRIPRQKAKRYPEYFFQPGEIDPETEVLFFFGSDDAWGILMLGEGPDASFAQWDNDGFVKRLPWTFTELIERLIDNDFAHTWAYDSHPETAAVKAAIARPHARRTTFELDVHAIERVSAAAYRANSLARLSDEALLKFAKAFAKPPKNATREQCLALIEEGLADPSAVTEKQAAAAMKATGHRKPTLALFAERYALGVAAIANLDATLHYVGDAKEVYLEPSTLLRALDAIDGVTVGESLGLPPGLVQYVYPPRWSVYSASFLSCEYDFDAPVDARSKRFRVSARAEQLAPLEAGKRYPSSALASV